MEVLRHTFTDYLQKKKHMNSSCGQLHLTLFTNGHTNLTCTQYVGAGQPRSTAYWTKSTKAKRYTLRSFSRALRSGANTLGGEDGAKMVAVPVDTKPARTILQQPPGPCLLACITR